MGLANSGNKVQLTARSVAQIRRELDMDNAIAVCLTSVRDKRFHPAGSSKFPSDELKSIEHGLSALLT